MNLNADDCSTIICIMEFLLLIVNSEFANSSGVICIKVREFMNSGSSEKNILCPVSEYIILICYYSPVSEYQSVTTV